MPGISNTASSSRSIPALSKASKNFLIDGCTKTPFTSFAPYLCKKGTLVNSMFAYWLVGVF